MEEREFKTVGGKPVSVGTTTGGSVVLRAFVDYPIFDFATAIALGNAIIAEAKEAEAKRLEALRPKSQSVCGGIQVRGRTHESGVNIDSIYDLSDANAEAFIAACQQALDESRAYNAAKSKG